MGNQVVTELCALWEHAFEAAVNRDYKAFKVAVANFNIYYRRATVEQQGSYHARVAESMKG